MESFLPIRCYRDFAQALRQAGFSLSGENTDGAFSLCDHFAENIAWHTDDPDIDPWAWRIRLIEEEPDVSYGKFFFRKGGYITRPWAPLFYALRREALSLDDLYREGHISRLEREVYHLVREQPHIPYHRIREQVGKKGLDGALARLQAGMYITLSGQTRRLSKQLEPYGWPVNTFCLTEAFWGEGFEEEAAAIHREDARLRIVCRLRALHPQVSDKVVQRFLRA